MSRTNTTPTQKIAYDYLRFSSREQAAGDSERRQREKAEAWCKRNGYTLDKTLSFKDLGVSAFHGDHRVDPNKGGLGAFLEYVRVGRITPGSVLLVENLDRLSRENPWTAFGLLGGLVSSGIRVVTLTPEFEYSGEGGMAQLFIAAGEFGRANAESLMKSDRVGAAWNQKKKRARENGEPLTSWVPAWLRRVGDKKTGYRFVVVEEKAAAVRRIYELAAAGYGIKSILKKLNEEGIPPISGNGHWASSYLNKILSEKYGPAVFGQFQPHLFKNKKYIPD